MNDPMKEFEIIDFHTHPFLTAGTNICQHREYCGMSPQSTMRVFQELGIHKICGSVIGKPEGLPANADVWTTIQALNDEALRLRDMYRDFYVPGFHIHPDFVEESCKEIERMKAENVKLVGELVPYHHGWKDYSCEAFSELLDVCEAHHMIVSFHSLGEDEMDRMVETHKNLVLVAAHPGEYNSFLRHMERMKKSNNYYLDISGTGVFRHGMLRHAIDLFGPERFMYGSDYPICNPGMFLGSVYFDNLITDGEKEMIFSKNARRLLGMPLKVGGEG